MINIKRVIRQRRRRQLAPFFFLAIGLGGTSVAVADDDRLESQPPRLVSAPFRDYCPPQPLCPPYWGAPSGSAERYGDVAERGRGAPPASETQEFASPRIPRAIAPISPSQSVAFTGGRGGGLDAPNMIGDTSAGGCGGLRVGGLVAATLDHPIYACSRLNIAENNSAIARDRAYVSYRHFHNAAKIDIFSYAPPGGASDFNSDVFTLGIEKLLSENVSIEFRLPIATQLTSDIRFEQGDTADPLRGPYNNNLNEIFADGRDTDIGNLSIILKGMLCRYRGLTVTAGLGLNLPTAPDLHIGAQIDDPNFISYNRDGTERRGPDRVFLNAFGTYENETVNIQPFLAFLNQVDDVFFTQGFMQIDVAANSSDGSLFIDYADDGYNDTQDRKGSLSLQSLLRVNFGGGAWLGELGEIGGTRIRHAALLEAHYTGTLNDPDRESVQIGTGIEDNVTLDIGPLADRTHMVNLTTGLASFVGKASIYQGFTVPLRDGMNRGFDFEYSLLINRNF